MKKWVLALTGILGLAHTTPLAAQAVGSYSAVERGGRSIVLSVGGGGQIGYWTRRNERTDLGLEVGVNGIAGEGTTVLTLSVTPALKRYHAPTGPLAPYTYLGIPLSYAVSESDDVFRVGGLVGFGLEWLPVPQVSLGGHVGLRASYHHQGGGLGLIDFGTVSSGIRMHLYF